MMPSIFRQDILVALEIAVERWCKQLVAALPAVWRDFVGANRWLIADADLPSNPGRTQNTRPTAVTLPPEEVLVRQIELPAISRFRLPGLMKYEARRHIPLPLNQVRFDFRIAHRDGASSRMLVELAIFRLATIEYLEARMLDFGEKPEAVFLTTAHGPWFARRPFSAGWRDRWLNRRQQTLLLRTVIPVLLIAAIMFGAQNWASRLAVDRDAAVTVALNQAAGIQGLRRQLANINDELSFIAGTRRQASAAALAEEVARLLPDDAWLQEFDLEGDNLRLLGTAREATDLLRVFSDSPFFQNVQFEAPLEQAPGTTGDQFDLSMTRN